MLEFEFSSGISERSQQSHAQDPAVQATWAELRLPKSKMDEAGESKKCCQILSDSVSVALWCCNFGRFWLHVLTFSHVLCAANPLSGFRCQVLWPSHININGNTKDVCVCSVLATFLWKYLIHIWRIRVRFHEHKLAEALGLTCLPYFPQRIKFWCSSCVNSNIKWFKWEVVETSGSGDLSASGCQSELWGGSCALRFPRPTPIPPLGTAAPSPLVPGVPQKVLRRFVFGGGRFSLESAELHGFRLAGPCYEVDRHAAVFNSDNAHTHTQCLVSELSRSFIPELLQAERYMGSKHWLQVGPILRDLWVLFWAPNPQMPSRTVWLHKLCFAGAWITSTTSFRRRSLARGCFGVEGRIRRDASLALKTRHTREQFISKVWCEPWNNRTPVYHSIPNQTLQTLANALS